jgi:hypothetical protein
VAVTAFVAKKQIVVTGAVNADLLGEVFLRELFRQAHCAARAPASVAVAEVLRPDISHLGHSPKFTFDQRSLS